MFPSFLAAHRIGFIVSAALLPALSMMQNARFGELANHQIAGPPGADREFVPITVWGREGLGRSGKPVLGIKYEIVAWEGHPKDPPLLVGETSRDEVLVPAQHFESGGQGELRARVRVAQPGFAAYSVPVFANLTEAHGPAVAHLPLRKGKTVYGRTFAASGAPIEANVTYKDSLDPKFRLTGLPYVQTLGDGWFAFHSIAGSNKHLWAYKNGEGVAYRADIVVSRMQEHEILTMSLSGPGSGVIEGRVLAKAGLPNGGVPVFVSWFDGFPSEAFLRFDSPDLHQKLTQGGLRTGSAVTRSDGRFRITGLLPGRYLAHTEETLYGWNRKLSTLPIETGDRDVLLTFSEPRLDVRLFDSEGGTWKGGIARDTADDDWHMENRKMWLSQWPSTPRVLVRKLASADPLSLPNWTPQPVDICPPNTVTSPVVENGWYSVQVIGGSFPGEARVIQARVPGKLAPLRFLAGPDVPLGRVKIQPRVDRQVHRRQKEALSFSGNRVWIADALHRQPMLVDSGLNGANWEVDLPPGMYFAAIEGTWSSDACMGTMDQRVAGRAEERFHVVSGETTQVELYLSEGGFLNVLLKERPGEPLRLGNLARKNFTPSRSITLELRGTEQIWEPLLRVLRPLKMNGQKNAGHPAFCWPMNQRIRSAMLPAGDFELVASDVYGGNGSQSVEIRAGQTTDVTVEIQNSKD